MKITIRNMATILPVVAMSLVMQACSPKIDARETEVINGLFYKIRDTEPFTGTITNQVMADRIGIFEVGRCDLSVKKGLQHGTTVCYAPGHIKISETETKNGKREGLEQNWDATTQKLIHTQQWSNGQKEGLEENFSSNSGKLISQINWSGNNKTGSEKHWNAKDGSLETDLTWNEGKKNGFERVSNVVYQYKNGLEDGVKKRYFVGPNNLTYLEETETYKAGVQEGIRQNLSADGRVVRERNYKAGNLMSDSDQPSVAPDVSSKVTVCVNAKIASFRKAAGNEALISNDVLQEWEGECSQ